MKFVTFLKIGLTFNIFCCLEMFTNKLFPCLTLTLNRKPFVRKWAINVGSDYSATQRFQKESSRRMYFKYSSLRCMNYRKLNYSLTKSRLSIMVFNEKLCKIKVFDAYPTLETCEEFLNNR